MILFLGQLCDDYKHTPKKFRKAKRDCYRRVSGHMVSSLWSLLTAPFIYPIWYRYRKHIAVMQLREHLFAQELNWFWFWVYTYGDLHDPLGRGGIPEDYRDGANTFKNRWFYSAIRNPRFTYNFLYYRTKNIVSESYVIDTRDFTDMIPSYGIGDSPNGILFKWLYSEDGTMYFIYENNTHDSIFYLGYTGLLRIGQGEKNIGRFEVAFRIK